MMINFAFEVAGYTLMISYVLFEMAIKRHCKVIRFENTTRNRCDVT